ncbi:MAG: prolipoprotein diacylglyceryl transferase [Sphingomonas sp.]|uniref:prolipoprotein diacylglyceryl transferase n=1 Tax=Sphingomonas sp. TaxID=28214 RepID=UPI001AC3BC8B|nr:prolipoprotein diacylglyceryl transferase [Sphingomonas sp.]MBN8808601.1 prolipoprotein diacylglyceryl transferase [Sphingomonas sp.]
MILHALTAIDFNDLHLNKVLLPIHLFGRDLFEIKWYSIAYIAGIVVGWMYLLRLLRAPGAPMAKRHAEDLVFYATLGIILGGRLGYVIFYAPTMFLHPLTIVRLWDGGMSFHGGVIGTSLGLILFARRHKLDWLRIHDYVACCVPFGLFFGRLANFVNGELWGRVADPNLPWAVIFHGTPNDVARHPSQLYEAGLEGIVLFAILWFAFWRTQARYEPGKLVGLFVGFYGLFRYTVEFFREPDSQYLTDPILGTPGLHMGQLLCLPMILSGAWLVWTAKGRRRRVTPIAGDEAVA